MASQPNKKVIAVFVILRVAYEFLHMTIALSLTDPCFNSTLPYNARTVNQSLSRPERLRKGNTSQSARKKKRKCIEDREQDKMRSGEGHIIPILVRPDVFSKRLLEQY